MDMFHPDDVETSVEAEVSSNVVSTLKCIVQVRMISNQLLILSNKKEEPGIYQYLIRLTYNEEICNDFLRGLAEMNMDYKVRGQVFKSG